jgi:hypothetical protein
VCSHKGWDEWQISRQARSLLLLAAAGCGAVCASAARASLFLELRTASVDFAHASAVSFEPGTKSFTLLGPGALGATLTMNIIAKVTAADANQTNDGLLSLAGSFLSTRANSSSPRGNLAASLLFFTEFQEGFRGPGSSNGAITDLNGDGDLDVGSNYDLDADGFFKARATGAPRPVFVFFPPFEIFVGTLRYLITDVGSASYTSINFRRRDVWGGANWYEDSVQNPDDGTWSGSHLYNVDPSWTIGTPVQVIATVPDPAMLSPVAAIALLARRRTRCGNLRKGNTR